MSRGAPPPLSDRQERRMASGRIEANTRLDYGLPVSTEQDRRNAIARRQLEARRETRETTDPNRWFFD